VSQVAERAALLSQDGDPAAASRGAFGSLTEIFPLSEIAGYRAAGHVTSEF
jgi:hypothetical protein